MNNTAEFKDIYEELKDIRTIIECAIIVESLKIMPVALNKINKILQELHDE